MDARTTRRRREEAWTLNWWTRTSIHLTLQSDWFEIVDKIKKAVLYLCIHVYIYIIYIHTHSYRASFPTSQQVQITIKSIRMCILIFYQSKNIMVTWQHASINRDPKKEKKRKSKRLKKMKLNTDSSCGFKIRTIGECGILQVKTAVKKKVLQNKPVACYNSHYKPWCPFPVCTLGKGSLFKSRAKEGWGEKKPNQTHFHSGHFPKSPLTSIHQLGPWPCRGFCSSALLCWSWEPAQDTGSRSSGWAKGMPWQSRPLLFVHVCVLYYISPTGARLFPH